MPPRKQPKTAAEKAKAAAEEDAWLDAEASRSLALLDAAAAAAAAVTTVPAIASAPAAVAIKAQRQAMAAPTSASASVSAPQKDNKEEGEAEAEERVKYCCNWCQAANPEMACGKCKTKYCSTECQTKAWPKHRVYCEMMCGCDSTEAARKVKAGEGSVSERLYDASVLGRYADIEKIVKEEGGDVNIVGRNGHSFLVAAVSHGHTRVCELLVRCGANVNHSYDDGTQPLLVAAMFGHAAIVTLLLDNGAVADAFNDVGLAAIHKAAVEGRVEAVTALLQHPCGPSVDLVTTNDDKYTALHIAARQGHGKVVKALLALNARVDALDAIGYSPLMLASMAGHVFVMKTLLKAGADPLLKGGAGGLTALHIAAINDRVAAIALLVAKGVPVDILADDGTAPLLLAVVKSKLMAVKALLDVEADPLYTVEGVTLLELAIVGGNADIIAALRAKIVSGTPAETP